MPKIQMPKKQADEDKKVLKVAEFLHLELCPHNHTDECSWYYHSWEMIGGRGHLGDRYIKMAKELIAILGGDLEKVQEVIKIIRNAR